MIKGIEIREKRVEEAINLEESSKSESKSRAKIDVLAAAGIALIIISTFQPFAAVSRRKGKERLSSAQRKVSKGCRLLSFLSESQKSLNLPKMIPATIIAKGNSAPQEAQELRRERPEV